MTVKDFWTSHEALAIYCDEKEKANKLLDKFDELGYTWFSGDSYLETNCYRDYTDRICYCNNNHFYAIHECRREEITVIEFDDLDDFKSKSKLLVNKEFNYLLGVIKPFIDDVMYIMKVSHNNMYYILISLKGSRLTLPSFPKESNMYKGLRIGARYTLEDLGFIPPLNCKAVCIKSNSGYYTVGKVYEFKDGHINTKQPGDSLETFNSVKAFNKFNTGYCELLQLVED